MTHYIFNETPIKTIHIGWKVIGHAEYLELFRVVEKVFEHPESDGYARCSCYDVESYKTFRRNSPNSSATIMLESIQHILDREVKVYAR